MTTRRGLLAGILAAGVAPAAVASGILMPVRQLVLPSGGGGISGYMDDIRITRWSPEGIYLCEFAVGTYRGRGTARGRDGDEALARFLGDHVFIEGRVDDWTFVDTSRLDYQRTERLS